MRRTRVVATVLGLGVLAGSPALALSVGPSASTVAPSGAETEVLAALDQFLKLKGVKGE